MKRKLKVGKKKEIAEKQIKDFIEKGDDKQEKGLLKLKQLRREKKWNKQETMLGWWRVKEQHKR